MFKSLDVIFFRIKKKRGLTNLAFYAIMCNCKPMSKDSNSYVNSQRAADGVNVAVERGRMGLRGQTETAKSGSRGDVARVKRFKSAFI